MKLMINGNEEIIDIEGASITELLGYKKVQMPEMVSVEYNGRFLKREEYESVRVKEGDRIEFLYFMGGGIK